MDFGTLGQTQLVTHFEKHGIGLSEGSFFGSPNHLRINFGCPRVVLEAGLTRMLDGLAVL